METSKHLLSDPGTWKATAEFVDPEGHIMTSEGEAVITAGPNEMISNVWIASDEINRSNSYRIAPVSPTRMSCESLSPDSKRLTGTFNVDRNMLFFKFRLEGCGVGGYQIIHRNGDVCYAHGALYDGDTLIQNWMATLNRQL
jgi:hypothetical protein